MIYPFITLLLRGPSIPAYKIKVHYFLIFVQTGLVFRNLGIEEQCPGKHPARKLHWPLQPITNKSLNSSEAFLFTAISWWCEEPSILRSFIVPFPSFQVNVHFLRCAAAFPVTKAILVWALCGLSSCPRLSSIPIILTTCNAASQYAHCYRILYARLFPSIIPILWVSVLVSGYNICTAVLTGWFKLRINKIIYLFSQM